ncbi:hypothetical protein FACS1894125_2450 [Actinomycetota bacterium]|nr:hypothetical protein FACS1894125_2450 [Actinomycetota bacterium]
MKKIMTGLCSIALLAVGSVVLMSCGEPAPAVAVVVGNTQNSPASEINNFILENVFIAYILLPVFASFLYFILLRLCRPKFRLSEKLALSKEGGKDVIRVKFINKALRDAYNVKIEVLLGGDNLIQSTQRGESFHNRSQYIFMEETYPIVHKYGHKVGTVEDFAIRLRLIDKNGVGVISKWDELINDLKNSAITLQIVVLAYDAWSGVFGEAGRMEYSRNHCEILGEFGHGKDLSVRNTNVSSGEK